MEIAWTTIISSAIGTALGALSSIMVNFQRDKQELKKLNQQRTFAVEDRLESERKSIEIDRFRTYNEILKVDGEYPGIYYDEDIACKQFYYDNYKNQLRPLLYANLHLLPKTMRILLREIDERMRETPDNLYAAQDLSNELANRYSKIIKEIESSYDKEPRD